MMTTELTLRTYLADFYISYKSKQTNSFRDVNIPLDIKDINSVLLLECHEHKFISYLNL